MDEQCIANISTISLLTNDFNYENNLKEVI